ncbi:MAG: hypothetical protein AAB074_20000 [Planctomycetota bacterium]
MNVSLLYFPSAIMLGALHALEPGHAKTLTTAYLIGTKGTKRDAVVLGLSVAVTHSIVVVALSALALWLGREAFEDRALWWLQAGSGIVVIFLGLWLVWRRWPRARRVAGPEGHAGAHAHHHHAPDPFEFKGGFAAGRLSIVDTDSGERFRLSLSAPAALEEVNVSIVRPGNRVEHHVLARDPADPLLWNGEKAPEEPHEFDAILEMVVSGKREELPFRMAEPEGHDDSHADLDEEAHARAHAATLPEYVHQGLRPTLWQIMAFGGAGGMIPCPAAISVMLLAISIGKTANGLLLVLGFSIGLALTLVSIGLAVVIGLKAIGSTGRFTWLSARAGIVSASVVVLSGIASLVVAFVGSHHH